MGAARDTNPSPHAGQIYIQLLRSERAWDTEECDKAITQEVAETSEPQLMKGGSQETHPGHGGSPTSFRGFAV